MSESVVTFQSQLSCVMETVFKAAMYEITRLVEDSFLEEVTRCREQVDSLKRRLKWSESRRREREAAGRRRGRCVDCGRVEITEDKQVGTEKSLKQESESQDDVESSQDEDVLSDEMEEAKPDVQSTADPAESPELPDERLDGLLKEEALQIPEESDEPQDWDVGLDEPEESGLPGPSKRFGEQKLPKCPVNWESGFEQRPESSQAGQSGDPAQPLFQGRYSMEDLDGFDKAAYADGNMMDMGNFDGLQDSPDQLGEDLGYVGHFNEDVEAAESADSQVYQKEAAQNRKGAAASPAASPSRTNMEVGGELSCLLINEEGFLQDPNVLYPAQASAADPGSRLSLRSQGVRIDPPVHSAENVYGASDLYTENLNLGPRLQHPPAGRSGRRHSCNQCSVTFPDSASLKAHKQTHKGSSQGAVHSCNECGKTFTQACNLKVHQRIHSGQGLHLCSHCGKGFPSFSELKAHSCGQTGDKPYCCTLCGNKFSRLWNLKLHRRIHTQEKPHQCSMCDKSFTRADILKVHQRTHTGERPYCCTVCGLSFKRLDHLKSHQRKHMTDL
ncbi:zinc finger protein 35 [Salarias fasciatus]|uniref:Zinc finger protein 35-like n=1 Tax=Salarias fasciatus TaxID=181472 RepID=A0A672GRJ0_SALFA|nr:zinc finger protein 35-like [Salarias fasciatus]